MRPTTTAFLDSPQPCLVAHIIRKDDGGEPQAGLEGANAHESAAGSDAFSELALHRMRTPYWSSPFGGRQGARDRSRLRPRALPEDCADRPRGRRVPTRAIGASAGRLAGARLNLADPARLEGAAVRAGAEGNSPLALAGYGALVIDDPRGATLG